METINSFIHFSPQNTFTWVYSQNSSVFGSPADVMTSCRDVHKFNTSEWCSFVNETDSCKIVDGFFDYTNFVYCGFNRGTTVLAMTILISWLLFLFVAMAVCADDFFCPPLVVIAKLLKMSDNVAGVTLLAFGNGAADVFSSIAAVKSAQGGDIGLAIGALLGAGILLATLIAGTICIITPCHMAERPFLRDVIFFMLSVFMVFFILFDKKVTLMESIAFLVTYLIYAVIVILGRWIYQKRKHVLELRAPVDVTESEEEADVNQLYQPDDNSTDQSTIDGNSEETPLLGFGESSITPLQEFIVVASPLNIAQFKQSRWYLRIYLIFKAPALFVLNFVIPIVDYNRRKNGWNRHMNTLHCILTPLVTVFIADPVGFQYYIGGKFPVYALILLLGSILAIVVVLTSKNSSPPVYHLFFAFLGFGAAVIWTDAIATEIVNVLSTMGIVVNISNAILGLTLLAWGNSVADFIADVVMARKGYPRAGLSACYGGPLFNILLGIGIPFTLTAAANGTQMVNFTLIQVVLVSSLLGVLAITLVAVPLLKFMVGKRFGIFLFVCYGLFLVFIILVETGIIKGEL